MKREDAASLPLPLFNIESFPIRTAATTSLSEEWDEVVKFMTARVFPFLRWHLNQRCGKKKSNKGNERGPRFLARRCRQILFSKFVKAWHAFKFQCCCSIPKRGEAFFFFHSPPFGLFFILCVARGRRQRLLSLLNGIPPAEANWPPCKEK